MNAQFKRIIFAGLSIMLLIAILFVGIHHFQNKNNQKIAKGKDDIQTERAESKYPGVDIITRTQDVNGIIIHEQYPDFQTESLNRAMQTFVKNERQNFAEELGNTKPSKNKQIKPYYRLYFDIFQIGEQAYSIVMHTEKSYAGANAEIRVQPFIINLKKDEVIDSQKLYAEEDYEKLSTFILEKLKSDEKIGSYIIDEAYQNFLKEHHLGERLVLTQEGAQFIFEPYSVGARAAGSPTVSLTLEELAQYLTDDAVKTIGQLTKNTVLEKGKKAVQARVAPELPKNMPAVVTHNAQAGKKVALTFDDGPHPENTPAILNLLDQYKAKATFFMLGKSADFYPDLVQKVAEAGHEVANHSWSHPQLTLLSDQGIQQEINQTDDAIRAALGYNPTLHRPPYGAYDDRVIQNVGKPLVLWSIDTLDWQSHDPQAILSIVKENLHDGAIILMHDVHAESVQGAKLVLEYLSSQGYEMVTVSELFK